MIQDGAMVIPRNSRLGFTLIELLAVIAIIGILAGLSFGLFSGVQSQRARSLASAELGAIALALESYRSVYGSYPATVAGGSITLSDPQPAPQVLFSALAGQREPLGESASRRPFLELNQFTVANANTLAPVNVNSDAFVVSGDYVFLDPWGNPYQYWYRVDETPISTRRQGYFLFSQGPSGTSTEIAPTGYLSDEDNIANADNLYPNR